MSPVQEHIILDLENKTKQICVATCPLTRRFLYPKLGTSSMAMDVNGSSKRNKHKQRRRVSCLESSNNPQINGPLIFDSVEVQRNLGTLQFIYKFIQVHLCPYQQIIRNQQRIRNNCPIFSPQKIESNLDCFSDKRSAILGGCHRGGPHSFHHSFPRGIICCFPLPNPPILLRETF